MAAPVKHDPDAPHAHAVGAVTTLTVAPFSDADLVRVQGAVALWIAQAGTCGYDHIGELPHRIYENLRGRRPVGDLVHVWSQAGRIEGLTICGRFGSAFDVLAAPALRGTSAERDMLLTATETTTRHLAEGEAFVQSDTFACDGERIRLLSELGFERFRTWDHVNERDLAEPIPPSQLPTGFVLRSARRTDADQLAAARNGAFDGSWTGELYRSAVMEKPGYEPAREIVAVAGDGRIVAFTVYWTDALNAIGHLEPVGTHPAFQRRGLARAVIGEAMRRMRDAGMRTVTVNHDAQNVPARELYRSVGFEKRHETLGFRLALGRERAHPTRSPGRGSMVG